mgnify:CR=1 FL=1
MLQNVSSQCLVDPTIKIYKDKNSKCLSIADIKIDNNNISHTYRLGLIESQGKIIVLLLWANIILVVVSNPKICLGSRC